MSGHADDDHERERADAEDSDLDRCRATVRSADGRTRRCARRARRAADGRRPGICAGHSASSSAPRAEKRGVPRDGSTAPRRKTDDQILLHRPTSQDEVAATVHRLAVSLERGDISPARCRLLFEALDRLSAHIERESADAETVVGGGVLRAIEGAAIRQAGPSTLRTLSLEDLARISGGVEEDRKRRVAPPADWEGLDRRYLSPPHAAAPKADDAPGDEEDSA